MSFSSNSSSRQKIQAIQFELWPDCCTGCQYCYLNGTKRTTTTKQKKKNILDALSTLQDPETIKNYNAVGLIGGEFFQGQIQDVKEEWIQLICYLNDLMKSSKIQEVWIASSLMCKNYEDVLLTLSYFDFDSFQDGQRVTLCTSYDTVGRFSEKQFFEAMFSEKFTKNSTIDDINKFLGTIPNTVDTEKNEEIIKSFEILKAYFSPVEKIQKSGLILPDGTLIDFGSKSKIDYYKLATDGVLITDMILYGAIKVDITADKNATLYFSKTVDGFSEKQLDQIMKIFQENNYVILDTTCPQKEYNEIFVECDGDNWRSERVWKDNIKKIKEIYPKLNLHVQTILTQDIMEKMIENPDYFDFLEGIGFVDFRYPSITRADCPSATIIQDYRSLLMQRYKDFPPKFFIEQRNTFLKFLKVLRKKYGAVKVQNLLHQPEMRSRRLKIYVDSVDIKDRWNDERDTYLPCGHLIDGLCYIDSPDKCVYCDVEKYLTTVGEKI